LWGVGSVAALGVLFYFVSQQSSPRAPGGSLTGNTPTQEAAADDAELQTLRAAVEKSPDDVEARLTLVRSLLVRQDMMGVFQETQAVLQRSPGNARALSYQALVRLAMGQAEQAEGMLKQALAKDPALMDAYLHLMLVYVRSQRANDAEQVLKDVSKRYPERADSFRQLLAEMRERARDEPQAAAAGDKGEDPHANVGVAEGRRPPAAGGAEKTVAGTLELDASLAGRSFGGAIVFVTLREGGFGAGPPLAAKRLVAASFPVRFEIGSADSMTGEPLPNDLLIEARIDSDGDPMTRPKSDPYGSADRVVAGSKDVKVVLKPR
jgi:cytochrome c-type biogenesis protein CcmH